VEGAAPLPARIPGARPPKPADAATLRALRQAAVANGVETAVLRYAAGQARVGARDDEAALRAALGNRLADFTLGVGVLGEIGPREAKPKPQAGAAPERPRKPSDPVPMEHAWRIEALVDGARVRAAIEAAGLALVSSADSSARAEVVLEAPYDAPMLAALRARLSALGGSSTPRRSEASGVTLAVRGLPPALVRERVASEPPAGFSAEVAPEGDPPSLVRVRLRAVPSAAVSESAKSRR
jgi:hypothetical protein